MTLDSVLTSKTRWTIVGLLFASIAINLVDRQVFAVLSPLLREMYGWSATQYAYAGIAFNLGMMIGQVPAGAFLDRVGTKIGLATIYRVLTQFESAGLVLKHNFEGGHAVYELDRGEHHDHMVDVDSGKVIEFHSDEIEALQAAIAAEHGYVIEDHALVLYVRKKQR